MVKTCFAVQNWVARAVRLLPAFLALDHPTVAHHSNGFPTTFIVLPLYSTLDSVNTRMLAIIIVVICTLQLFALTLIIR